jgi:two-component system, sensor histidine kinase and response regulator
MPMKKTLSPRPSPRLCRPTALVVDDNPMDRELAASTLRDRGLEPLIARDGFEAIRLLSGGARHLAVLIVDTEMPGVHGWEVIRFARGKAPAMPILRLGRPDDEVPGHEYRTLRAVPVLPKPFTVAQLIASLGPRIRPRHR